MTDPGGKTAGQIPAGDRESSSSAAPGGKPGSPRHGHQRRHRLQRAGAPDRLLAGLAGIPASLLQRRDRRRALRVHPPSVRSERGYLPGRGGLHPRLRAGPGRDAQPARAGLLPSVSLAVVYTDIFRGVPGILVIYILGFGMPSLDIDWSPQLALLLGCHGASARVHRLRQRGLSRRHRLGAPEPGGCRSFTGSVTLPGDALRRPATGHPARRPAAC